MTRTVSSALLLAIVVVACKPKESVGLVAEAGAPVTTTSVPEAGAVVDVMQCAGCATPSQPGWSFAGIYRDAKCTEPLAQTAPGACATIAALGPTSLTFTDESAPRKAGEAANVTLTEQIAPEAPRYRKAGTACVAANESAIDLTPLGCVGQRVCRDANGALTCTGACRTFASGCPDFEETRLYAAFTDPAKGATAAAGGGNSLARLRQCCAQLGAEAKRLGASPEAGMVSSAAHQCTTIVNAAGPNGTAPEMGVLRALLVGRNLPAVCSGF